MSNSLQQSVMPSVYRFVKRHKRVREVALRVWGALSRVSGGLRGLLPGSKPLPVPTRYMDTADWVNQQLQATPAGAGRPSIREVFPPMRMVRPLPGTIDPVVHWKFRANVQKDLAPAFVAEIPQGRVCGQGFVITPDDVLLGDVSREIVKNEYSKETSRHPLLAQGTLPPPRKVRGRVAVLATFSGRGFGHWMSDVLPRIEILRAGGIDLESVAGFYVNECVATFHFTTLEAAGIPRSKLLQNQWNPHVQAEELIVPSHAGELASTPLWAHHFLRRTLMPGGSKLTGNEPTRIYIHRQNNLHRKVTNDTGIVALLQKLGFAIIDPENLSLAEQTACYAAARVIVAPHGSGLGNLVFCEPGAKVVEIFHPKAVSLMHWSLCVEMKLDYYYLLAMGERSAEGVDEFLNADDITVNLDDLREILRVAGVE